VVVGGGQDAVRDCGHFFEKKQHQLANRSITKSLNHSMILCNFAAQN
jgi:hypothetical protein